MNDKQMLEQAIENAQEVVNRLKEQYREQYGYTNKDLVDILEHIKKSKTEGLSEYEIRRKSRRYTSMSKKHLGGALEELIGDGAVEVYSVSPSFGGGRPRVAYVAKEFSNI